MAKSKGRIVLLHGIEGDNPKNGISQLKPYFERHGFCVALPHYGALPLFGLGLSALINPRVADTLSNYVKEDDILVGHSNGATISYLVSLRQKVRGCVFINPALDPADAPNADFTHVYFNRGDWVVRASGLVPFNDWGCMGAVGYIGLPQYRLQSIDCGNPPYVYLPRINGHSKIFKPENIGYWGPYIAEMVKKEIE